jgi:choline dehydrogenase-like flavoprotein
MSHHYDLISIGSGPAGRRGAIQAAKLGKRVAIVEQGRIIGVCLETGDPEQDLPRIGHQLPARAARSSAGAPEARRRRGTCCAGRDVVSARPTPRAAAAS